MWRRRIVELLDAYEATIRKPDLDPAYRTAFQKCRRDILRAVEPLGLDAIEPAPGEPFDEQLHRIVGDSNSPGADHSRIAEVVRCGYRTGSEVLRHCDVVTGFVEAGAAAEVASEPASAPTRRVRGDLFTHLQQCAQANAGESRE